MVKCSLHLIGQYLAEGVQLILSPAWHLPMSRTGVTCFVVMALGVSYKNAATMFEHNASRKPYGKSIFCFVTLEA
jgi:hypothetical protein